MLKWCWSQTSGLEIIESVLTNFEDAMSKQMIRIGAGCSVDTTLAWPQMANHGQLDYFVADYLYEAGVAGYAAELTSNPEAGYSTEFVGPELEPWLRSLVEQGVRIVTNAGGLNPLGCASALQAVTDRLGLKVKIAVVHGDNVLDILGTGRKDMFSGEPLPANLNSANAYLGARPVAQALAMGADIVITGRVVDSALIVGPLMYEFGWSWEDYERLGAATVIGHLLECGPQPSGGICTDWRDVDFSNMSFPIAECFADGSAILTKVPGTGGQVSIGTTAEQILYETTDPQRYLMPDVTCDLSQVKLELLAPDRVRVTGGTGVAPTGTYKVCCMKQQGWRSVVSGCLSGPDAHEKAQRTAEAIVKRLQRLAHAAGHGDFIGTSIELIGSGASQGARASAYDAREMVYRIVVDHVDRRAVEPLVRVARAAGVSMAPGTAGLLGASVSPLMRMYSTLLDKARVPVYVTLNGETVQVDVATTGAQEPPVRERPAPLPKAKPRADDAVSVPLVRLAWTRSGDKGNLSNIGVIARRPEYLPYINAALTTDAIRDWFAHLYASPEKARVECYELPGLHALNFVLHDALAGGAVSSRNFDTMGKSLGQQLIEFPVAIPHAMAEVLQ
ncbi:DUF1446 domain-containing protein [Burkholderia multivorans]|uniref:acyclic terpene utilization AtuA family protein n=1 Tax=Burkholderia multivorans TaxID=87883 RepID=UPI001C24A289|nr:acyclic terpene utilization AtuA family protein [Burkholderia multivorans]MBU9371537.1 DUF1446 domain-containing protein [Burkholderia multivorans]